MITIGICDDEKIQRRDIKEMCEKYMYDTHMDFKFVEFTSGEEVMAYKGEKIHLLLLDVELGGVDGLEVLKYVEEADWVWRVVFVTSHDEVMGRSFGIKTLDFAKKPITYAQIDKWIQVTLKENRENVVFEFSTTNGAMFKSVEDIYCLEAEGNYSDVKMNDIKRYRVNLAQIRILGEKEYYAFMKGEGLLAFISDYFSGIDELKEEINNNISIVRYYADLLNINMSVKITNIG